MKTVHRMQKYLESQMDGFVQDKQTARLFLSGGQKGSIIQSDPFRRSWIALVYWERTNHKIPGELPQVVETVPGWAHDDITNIGEDEMMVLIWANEIFDQNKPDTIAMKVTL